MDGSQEGHLGLGFDVVSTAVEISGRSRQDIAALITDPDIEGLLRRHHTREYFTVDRHSVISYSSFAPGFAIIIIFEGDLQMTAAADEGVAIRKGNTVVVPFEAGTFR